MLAAIGGAIAALGHAPFGLWPVALFGFALLIWAYAATDRPFRVGWAGGAGYFAVALHWIVEPFLVDVATHGWMAPFALLLLSGGLALFWGGAAWTAARFLGQGTFAFAVMLTVAEMVRSTVFTGFPWALPAYIWTDTSVRMTAAWWGPFGLTLLTLTIAALPVSTTSWGRRILAAGAAVVSIAALWVGGEFRQGTDDRGDRARVMMVQPNAPQDQKWDPAFAHTFVERQIEFTSKHVDEAIPPDLIIWPEAAIPYVLDQAGSVLSAASNASGGIPILLGINRRNEDQWYNSAVMVGEGGTVIDTYDKVHLVPFGEYIPGRIDLLRAIAARSNFGFTPGERVRTVETPIGRALVLICYEAIFPGFIRRAETRPEVLIQITNDAWFGTFAGPFQHLQQAQFRAAEQGLPVIRVANTGVSASIDAWGEVQVHLPLNEAGWTTVHLPKSLPATPYARLGDLPLTVVLFALVTSFAFFGRRNRIAKARPTS